MAALAPLKVAIIGGSIGGLAAANTYHRLGATVSVFEKSSTGFTGRGGSIGFCQVPLWEAVRGEPMMRRGERASRQQGGWVYGDLWTYLFEGLPRGVVRFGRAVDTLGDDPLRPRIDGETYDLAIVADGGWSELRGLYFERTRPVYAGYQAWRFRVEASAVPGFTAYGEYGSGVMRAILLDIIADKGTDYIMGGTTVPAFEKTVQKPSNGENRQAGASDNAASGSGLLTDAVSAQQQKEFLELFRSSFGQHENGELLRAMEAAASRGKITPTPQFEFGATSVIRGRIVLVGDAAHMASPRTAAGAHTALQDAYFLHEAFAEVLKLHSERGPGPGPGSPADKLVAAALAIYGPKAVTRAQALLLRSHAVSSEVVPKEFKRAKSIYLPPTLGMREAP